MELLYWLVDIFVRHSRCRKRVFRTEKSIIQRSPKSTLKIKVESWRYKSVGAAIAIAVARLSILYKSYSICFYSSDIISFYSSYYICIYSSHFICFLFIVLFLFLFIAFYVLLFIAFYLYLFIVLFLYIIIVLFLYLFIVLFLYLFIVLFLYLFIVLFLDLFIVFYLYLFTHLLKNEFANIANCENIQKIILNFNLIYIYSSYFIYIYSSYFICIYSSHLISFYSSYFISIYLSYLICIYSSHLHLFTHLLKNAFANIRKLRKRPKNNIRESFSWNSSLKKQTFFFDQTYICPRLAPLGIMEPQLRAPWNPPYITALSHWRV